MCLEALLHMSDRWKLAENCHSVLSDLKEAIQDMEHAAKRPAFGSISNSVHSPTIHHHVVGDSVSSTVIPEGGSRKRTRLSSEPRPRPNQNNDESGQSSNQDPITNSAAFVDGPLSYSFDTFNATGSVNDDYAHSIEDPGRPNSWESGVPDLLAGITWESLLGGIDQDDISLDNAFF